MGNQDAQPFQVIECDDTETDMEAFYASLESSSEDTTSPSHVASLKTMPSEETQEKIQILQHLVSKKFSFLFHPKHSIVMKDTLKYLLSLAPDEGFSTTTKSEMRQLLQCFAQWSLEYYNAGLSATAELSKAGKLTNELEANVKKFQVMEMEEKCLSNQLASLEEKKRKLEEKINALKIQIANATARRERVGERKVELFQKGKEVKAKRDDLRVKMPRLKAEQRSAKIIRANIEAEWFKLQKQFIRSSGIKDWI